MILMQSLIDFIVLLILSIKYKIVKKANKGTGCKILTPKQMLQRLPIAYAQVKAGNNSREFIK